MQIALKGFVKNSRKEAGLTQEEFTERADIVFTVIRKIEQGKGNLQLEKVNQMLKMFGHVLAPVRLKAFSTDQEQETHK